MSTGRRPAEDDSAPARRRRTGPARGSESRTERRRAVLHSRQRRVAIELFGKARAFLGAAVELQEEVERAPRALDLDVAVGGDESAPKLMAAPLAEPFGEVVIAPLPRSRCVRAQKKSFASRMW